MENAQINDCSGCKIASICGKQGTSEPCETNLRAVLLVFVIPLILILAVLLSAQDRVGEGIASLIILAVLAVYFAALRFVKINNKQTKK